MLHERRDRIIKKIMTDRMVKIHDLMKEYNVSIETIRRDLEFLEDNGHIKRVYGGAVLVDLYAQQEPEYSYREIANLNEKRAIARKTAELIEDGDTLFVDVGTTTLEVVHALESKKNIVVITNGSLIARAAISHGIRAILLGGEMRSGEFSVSGSLCEANMENFYANKAIIGVGGITTERGLTDYIVPEVSVRKKMIERSDKAIAVADHSKFGITAMNCVCKISDLDFLVTDEKLDAKTILEYKNAGLNMITSPL